MKTFLKILLSVLIIVLAIFDSYSRNLLTEVLEKDSAGFIQIIYIISVISAFVCIWRGEPLYFLISLAVILATGFVVPVTIEYLKTNDFVTAYTNTMCNKAMPWYYKLFMKLQSLKQ